MTLADARSRDDASLVEATRDGDHAAFSELFERHRAAVEHLADALIAGRDSDTLVSAVFVEGLGRILDGEASDGALRPWFLQVTADCHGAPVPSTTAGASFHALAPAQQAILWSAIVEDAPVDAGALSAAADSLRGEYLRRQREDAASRHARTHLDDLAGHADTCATCLGIWWSADDLTTPASLTRAVLGPAGERYVHQPSPDHRRSRPRPRWVPVTLVASVAGALLATSIGALAVAQWGPGSVPTSWRTLAPVPAPTASTPPPAPEPIEPTTPEPSVSAEPDEPPSSTAPPTTDPAPAPGPTAAPTTPTPDQPADMRVGFAFEDPRDETLTRDGTTYEARHIQFQLLAEPAQGSQPRTVSVRFEFVGSVTYLGASGGLSCTPSGRTITCLTSLAPGDSLTGSIVVEDDRGEGRAVVSTSDAPSAVSSHQFSFGPWAGAETISPPPPSEDATSEAPAS